MQGIMSDAKISQYCVFPQAYSPVGGIRTVYK